MEEFPSIGEKRQIPYTLSIYPFLRDHRIPSGAILPAVHSMQILVDVINQHYTGLDTRTLCNASFGKLLYLPDDQETADTWVEIESPAECHLRVSLLSKSRSKSGIVRSLPHAGFEVSKAPQEDEQPGKAKTETQGRQQRSVFDVIPGLTRNLNGLHWAAGFAYRIKSGMTKYQKHHKSNVIRHDNNFSESIPVRDIYPGLVCFAEGFQNVIEPVRTSETGAVTRVSGGKPVPGPAALGSPFPLDAAFQAACAWGRKYTGQICYPVAFEKRSVFQPTQAFELYDVEVLLLNQEGGTLEFDLSLKNSQGKKMEQVEGLKMRELGIGPG